MVHQGSPITLTLLSSTEVSTLFSTAANILATGWLVNGGCSQEGVMEVWRLTANDAEMLELKLPRLKTYISIF